MLSNKPFNELASLLTALSVSCEMRSCELQNRFLQPIQDSDRQGERNSRVFLKAKEIQTSSQLNAIAPGP